MASNKTNLRPIYRTAKKMAHSIEYYVNQKVAQKLYESIITNVTTSFGPETEHGKEVDAYNKYQKKNQRSHTLKLPYHRSGTLLQAIRVIVTENNEVQLIVDKLPYKDETGKRKTTRTALDVYKYLNNGTSGSNKVYPFMTIKGATTGKKRYTIRIRSSTKNRRSTFS